MRTCELPGLLTCAADKLGGCRTFPTTAACLQKAWTALSMLIGLVVLLEAFGPRKQGGCELQRHRECGSQVGHPASIVYLAVSGHCLSSLAAHPGSLRRWNCLP
jgi:hypothetical protein